MALAVCADGYYCASLPAEGLLGFNEKVIHLARRVPCPASCAFNRSVEVLFRVCLYEGGEVVGLPGVDGRIVRAGGVVVEIGTTDEAGCLTFPRTRLRELDGIALLLCQSHFYCGTVLLDGNELLPTYDMLLQPLTFR